MKTPPLDAFTRHAASQVIYQIFPERFAIGGGLGSAEKLANPAYNLPRAVKRGWDEPPLNESCGDQFYGGDLDGIVSRLEYLTDLGVTGVYLTPIFTSPSNHKYDATDFFSIDPMFGGEEALKRLTDALHGGR
jgi:alpha-glucosidase